MSSRRSTIALSAVVAIGILLPLGCGNENGVKPVVNFRDVHCPDVDCTKVFVLDSPQVEQLRVCYDPEDAYPGTWHPGTPQEISGICDVGGGTCEVRLEPAVTAPMTDRGCCVDDFPSYPDDEPPSQCLITSEPDPVDICTMPQSIPTTEWDLLGSELAESMESCGVTFEVLLDCNEPTAPRTWGDLCPT